MKSFFLKLFTWWNSQTFGTQFWTWLYGEYVGTDEFGNRYYIQKRGVGPLGVPRRWVTYKSMAEPSQVPPEWHGWLHYTVDSAPTEQSYTARPWQLPHRMNKTGTSEAYRPAGSIVAKGERPHATGDYKPWRPT